MDENISWREGSVVTTQGQQLLSHNPVWCIFFFCTTPYRYRNANHFHLVTLLCWSYNANSRSNQCSQRIWQLAHHKLFLTPEIQKPVICKNSLLQLRLLSWKWQSAGCKPSVLIMKGHWLRRCTFPFAIYCPSNAPALSHHFSMLGKTSRPFSNSYHFTGGQDLTKLIWKSHNTSRPQVLLHSN